MLHAAKAKCRAEVQELVATLNALKVPKAEQDEILSVFGPMRADIVEVP
jgi:hypothetical protein